MTDILIRAMNIAERIRAMEELSVMATAAFGVLLVFGIMNCILGYRLLRFWMMLFGFAMGAGAGFFAVYRSGTTDKTIYLAAMGALGVVLAIVAFLIFKAGIFIMGAGLGMTLSIYIIHPTTSFTFFLCILMGAGLGALAMRYEREVIIVGTSLLGGVLAGFSGAKLAGLSEIPYGILMSAGAALLGMLLQFAINKPKYEEEEPREIREPGKKSRGAKEEKRRRTEPYRKEKDAGYPGDVSVEDGDDSYGEDVLLDEDDFEDYFTGKLDLNKDKKSGEPLDENEETAELHRKAWDQKRSRGARRGQPRPGKIDRKK